MITPVHNAEFAFAFSLIIGPSFSFNLCPSYCCSLWDVRQPFCVFFFISTPSPFTSWLKILFLIISYHFCCGFFWLFYHKTEENTVEYICMASAVFYKNTSLYCQRCITGDFLSCLARYSSQSWDFRSICFSDSSIGRRKYLPLHSWMFVKSIKRTMKSKI